MIKFIIIGVILAVRLYLRSKKTQENSNGAPRQRNNPRKPVATTPSLEEILKELSGETKQNHETPTPQQEYTRPASRQPEREKIEIEDHQYDFRPEYEHHADIDGPSIQEIRKEISESQQLVATEVTEEKPELEFDIRQAIVAETILNRPEY